MDNGPPEAQDSVRLGEAARCWQGELIVTKGAWNPEDPSRMRKHANMAYPLLIMYGSHRYPSVLRSRNRDAGEQEARKMKRSILVATVLVVLLPGCGEENLHSPFLIRVSDINEGSPTFADVIEVVEEGPPRITAIPTSLSTVRITNKPYSPGVVSVPSTFWLDFQLTSYNVTWRRADGGPTSGTGWVLTDFDFEAGTTEIIPIGATIEMAMQVVPVSMKSQVPFVNARSPIDGGTGENFRLIADIEFVGHPVTAPDTEYRFQASTTVEIADFAD